MALVAQASEHSPQKVQAAEVKSATGKPPSPRFNNPVGQAETQSSQRVQASTNTASGMLQGGRNGETRVLLPKKRRRDGSMIHETSR